MPPRKPVVKPKVSSDVLPRQLVWPPWDPVPDLVRIITVDERIKKELLKMELQKKIQLQEIQISYMKEMEKILG